MYTIFFSSSPAPGYRGNGEGALGNVGSSGYSWSSTVSSAYGVNLGFSVAWLDPNYANDRANGRQLRCLSE